MFRSETVLHIVYIIAAVGGGLFGVVNLIFYKHVKKDTSNLLQTIAGFATMLIAICLLITQPVTYRASDGEDVGALTANLMRDGNDVEVRVIAAAEEEYVKKRPKLFGEPEYTAYLHSITIDLLKIYQWSSDIIRSVTG